MKINKLLPCDHSDFSRPLGRRTDAHSLAHSPSRPYARPATPPSVRIHGSHQLRARMLAYTLNSPPIRPQTLCPVTSAFLGYFTFPYEGRRDWDRTGWSALGRRCVAPGAPIPAPPSVEDAESSGKLINIFSFFCLVVVMMGGITGAGHRVSNEGVRATSKAQIGRSWSQLDDVSFFCF